MTIGRKVKKRLQTLSENSHDDRPGQMTETTENDNWEKSEKWLQTLSENSHDDRPGQMPERTENDNWEKSKKWLQTAPGCQHYLRLKGLH